MGSCIALLYTHASLLTMSSSIECPLCNFVAPSTNRWVSHLRSVHEDDTGVSITCGINGCTNWYDNTRSFASHAYRQHKESVVQSSSTSRQRRDDSEPFDFPSFDENADVDYYADGSERSDLQHTVDQIMGTDHEEQKRKMALFMLNLKEIRCLSESAVQHVSKETEKVFRHTMGRVRAGVNECIARSGHNLDDIPNLNQVLSDVQHPFKDLKSTFLQDKFYEEKLGCLVSAPY